MNIVVYVYIIFSSFLIFKIEYYFLTMSFVWLIGLFLFFEVINMKEECCQINNYK